MSVKISRREEKRNTSLRDFILAAVFPLLLAGLIGFLIGKAGGVDDGVNSDELAVLSTQAKQANEKLMEFESYSTSIDSLRMVLNEEVKNFDKSYFEAIQAGINAFDPTGSPLQRWGEELIAANQRLADDLTDIYGPALGRNILSKEHLDALTDPLRNLTQEKFKALRKLKNDYNSKNLNQEQISLTITKQEEDAREKIDESKKELDLTKYDLAFTRKELEHCESNLLRANANEPPLPPSFATEKQAIKVAISDIRKIIPNLPKGLLGKKKELREELIDAVETIDLAAGKIE